MATSILLKDLQIVKARQTVAPPSNPYNNVNLAQLPQTTTPIGPSAIKTSTPINKEVPPTKVGNGSSTIAKAHNLFKIIILVVVLISAFTIIAGDSPEAGKIFVTFFIGLVVLQLLTHGIALSNFVNNL